MDILHLWMGLQIATTPFNLLVGLAGIVLGVIVGVLPGLGGANGCAILIPLTFVMPPTAAVILLSSLYWGALYGGAITSILYNIPGEPWAVAVIFDGYPMAKRGEGGRALHGPLRLTSSEGFFAVLAHVFCTHRGRVLLLSSGRLRRSP